MIRRAEQCQGEVLINAHKIPITVEDISTLSGLEWLNDKILDFYLQVEHRDSVYDDTIHIFPLQMIEWRSRTGRFCPVLAFTTYFYPKLKDGGHASVQRWTKKVDIFSYSLILVPVHLGKHWCLATIDMNKKAITYYDSLGGDKTACVESLAEYLKVEHLDKKGVNIINGIS